LKKIEESKPVGIVLSGGPDSVCREGSPHLPAEAFETGLPTLGICYGLQLIAHSLGGRVVPGGDRREFGKAVVEVHDSDLLFKNLPGRFQGWMSHGDRVDRLPTGFQVLAESGNIVAAAADPNRKIWGLQFHPEVIHTHHGSEILNNFLTLACHCKREWTMSAFIQSTVRSLAEQIGSEKVICGLSGGVDSTVACA
jgi:GMP synthase (glutamine-hydrolysing)